MHTCIHTYIRTYVCTYIQNNIHTYIHSIAYIHTYIHNIVLDAKTVSVVWEPIPLIHPNHKNPHLPNNARLFAPGAAVWRWSATGQVAFSYALPCRKPQSSQYPLNPWIPVPEPKVWNSNSKGIAIVGSLLSWTFYWEINFASCSLLAPGPRRLVVKQLPPQVSAEPLNL